MGETVQFKRGIWRLSPWHGSKAWTGLLHLLSCHEPDLILPEIGLQQKSIFGPSIGDIVSARKELFAFLILQSKWTKATKEDNYDTMKLTIFTLVKMKMNTITICPQGKICFYPGIRTSLKPLQTDGAMGLMEVRRFIE